MDLKTYNPTLKKLAPKRSPAHVFSFLLHFAVNSLDPAQRYCYAVVFQGAL